MSGAHRAPPRAIATSDVTRPRTLALAALGAAAGAAVALFTGHPQVRAERPMPRPHEKKPVACAKCHEAPPGVAPETFAAAGACKACHDPTTHATRPAHRALAQRGELSCATCHPPHEGAQGVTFAEGGAFVRWGAGVEAAGKTAVAVRPRTTVPLVSLGACDRCHDVTRAADPIAACVAPEVRRAAGAGGPLGKVPSLCFDEHRTLATAGARFVAWDAARDVAASTPWLSPTPRSDGALSPLGGAFAGAAALGLVATALERRRRAPAKVSSAEPATPPAKRRLPVVDPSTCLGCHACVDACPFDVFVVERYVAVVARPEECCGVVLCAQVCPNGSLTIEEGAPIPDRPTVDGDLESADVPGLFVAGDLTGLPLIKNAINQGARAVDRILATLPRRRSEPIDVLVVGAGPAGLAAALRAKEKGLSCVVLEQATVAASIRSFPRDKIVHDPPLDVPLEGELWLREATKEELLAQWSRIVRTRALDVREGQRVTALDKRGDAFVVSTAGGETFRASRVVLAIGRRGTPRTLDLHVEPGSESRISYSLADARSFAGKRVVIVGLGDSAMEAAIALAHQPGTSVTISYRGAGFRRGKSRNVDEVKSLVDKGRLRILFDTIPVAVTEASVTLQGTVPGRGRRTVPADALLVLIGGIPSWDLLVRSGVRRPGDS